MVPCLVTLTDIEKRRAGLSGSAELLVPAWYVRAFVTVNLLIEHFEMSLSLSLSFNGHFPGETGLAGVYWSKGWWRCWWQLDYWSCKSCKAPVKSSPPTNQHPVFTGRMPFLSHRHAVWGALAKLPLGHPWDICLISFSNPFNRKEVKLVGRNDFGPVYSDLPGKSVTIATLRVVSM